MTEAPVVGPLGELDLGHERGLDPVDACGCRWPVTEGRLGDPKTLEPGSQGTDRGLREARADLSGVDERALAVVDTQEERAQAGTRPLGLGEAADDELLLVGALDLEPAAAPGRLVRLVPPLRDDALEAEATGLAEEALALAHHVTAVADRALPARREEPLERGLAVLQTRGSEVAAVQVEEVEHEVDDRVPPVAGERVLQRLEARGPVPEHHGDLAVEECLTRRKGGGGLGDLRKAGRPIVPVATPERRAAAGEPAEDSIAVELGLVKPGIPGGRSSDEGRELGRDEGGERSLTRAGNRPGRRALRLDAGRRSGPLRRDDARRGWAAGAWPGGTLLGCPRVPGPAVPNPARHRGGPAPAAERQRVIIARPYHHAPTASVEAQGLRTAAARRCQARAPVEDRGRIAVSRAGPA